MTKTELYNEVTKLMADFEDQFKSKKSFTELSTEIDKLLKPKAGGGVVQNPPKIIDGTTYHYCRYSGLYVQEDQMVMSNGKSKGYSKRAIAKWTKAGKEAQIINEEAMKLLLAGNVEEGTTKAQEAEDLKTLRNKQDYYEDVKDELIDNNFTLETK
jgi:hypothetical protein